MKNEKENINSQELKLLKISANSLLSYTDELINNGIKKGELKEVLYE